MNAVEALILGIVEGLTEFLPVSSTAHLEITSTLLKIPESTFINSFEIVIQFGAILAVLALYTSRLQRNVELWKRIVIAFIPTVLIAFSLYKIIKGVLLENIYISLAALIIGGVILIFFELVYKHEPEIDISKELDQMSYKKAALIGVVQALAIIPGVSRSGATIVAGRALGLSRKAIIEFSFLLAIPTIAAASGYELLENAAVFKEANISLLIIGFCSAAVAAFLSVKFFIRFIEKHSFVSFGIYRIVFATVVLALLMLQ
jgi:undecaprenyl-diphosphatase